MADNNVVAITCTIWESAADVVREQVQDILDRRLAATGNVYLRQLPSGPEVTASMHTSATHAPAVHRQLRSALGPCATITINPLNGAHDYCAWVLDHTRKVAAL